MEYTGVIVVQKHMMFRNLEVRELHQSLQSTLYSLIHLGHLIVSLWLKATLCQPALPSVIIEDTKVGPQLAFHAPRSMRVQHSLHTNSQAILPTDVLEIVHICSVLARDMLVDI